MPSWKDDSPYSSADYWADAEHYVYIRKSLVLGEEDRISAVKQKDAIDGSTAELGLPAPTYFYDTEGHRSGRHEHTRPGWRQVKARFLSAKKSILTVYELDRSNRNVMAMSALIEQIRIAPERYRLILLMNRFDSARDGWGARDIKSLHDDASDAQYESDKAAERMSKTIKTLQQHLVPWGTTPYGLLRVGRGMKARWTRGKHADQVALALELWGKGGLSYAAVAGELNTRGMFYYKLRPAADGARTALPEQWDADRVRQLVGNVLQYAGYVVPRAGRSKARKARLEGDGTLLERCVRAYGAQISPSVDAIISADIAELVIRKRVGVQVRGRKPASEWYPLLSGVAMHGARLLRSHQTHGIRYYRTRNGRPALSWHADDVERELIDNLRGTRFPPAVVTAIKAELDARTSNAERAHALATIGRMEKALLDLERKSALGECTPAQYSLLKAEFQETRAAAQKRAQAPSDVDRAIEALTALSEVLTRGKPAARWRAVHALFESVELTLDGGIGQLTPRAWAKQAFGQLAFAWHQIRVAESDIPKVTPTGVESPIGISDGTLWTMSRLELTQ